MRRVLVLAKLGPNQLQATIRAVHCTSESFESTDCRQIYLLYERLYQIHPTKVIQLNAIVALSYATTPEAALEALNAMDDATMKLYQPYHAAKADILQRCGDLAAASQSYDLAIQLSDNNAEKQLLAGKKKLLKT